MSEKIIQAIYFVTKAHETQVRKGTNVPYVVHSIQVMQLVAICDGTEDMQIAALLHDTLEDTKVSEDEILSLFGEDCLSIVKDLTEPRSQEDKSLSWKKRKLHTLDALKILRIPSVCVSLCDKFDNLSSIQRDKWFLGNKIWERFRANFEEQSWYYEKLVEVFAFRKKEMNSKFGVLVDKFKDLYTEVFKNHTF